MDNLKLQILKSKLKKQNLKIKIITDSMTPLIKVGEVVLVEEAGRTLKPFDIIIFLGSEHRLICHYVLKVFENGNLITTNLKKIKQRDTSISKDVILGTVKDKYIPFFYKLKTFLTFLFR